MYLFIIFVWRARSARQFVCHSSMVTENRQHTHSTDTGNICWFHFLIFLLSLDWNIFIFRWRTIQENQNKQQKKIYNVTRPMRKMTKKQQTNKSREEDSQQTRGRLENAATKIYPPPVISNFFIYLLYFIIIIPALWHHRKSANRIELISKLNTKHAELCGSNIPHTHRSRRIECRVKYTHRSTAARQLTLRCAADTDADCTNDSANSEPTEPRTSVPLSSLYNACMCVHIAHSPVCPYKQTHSSRPTTTHEVPGSGGYQSSGCSASWLVSFGSLRMAYVPGAQRRGDESGEEQERIRRGARDKLSHKIGAQFQLVDVLPHCSCRPSSSLTPSSESVFLAGFSGSRLTSVASLFACLPRPRQPKNLPPPPQYRHCLSALIRFNLAFKVDTSRHSMMKSDHNLPPFFFGFTCGGTQCASVATL